MLPVVPDGRGSVVDDERAVSFAIRSFLLKNGRETIVRKSDKVFWLKQTRIIRECSKE